MDNNRKNRLVGIGISWTTLVAQIVISLLFVPFFLRTVGDRQYGLYAFSSSIIAWLSTFLIAITTGYYKFVTKEKKERGDEGEAVCSGVFLNIYVVLAIIMLIVGLLFDLLIYGGVIKLNEYSIAEKNQICILILFSVITSFLTTIFTTQKNHPYYKEKYIFIYTISLIEIVTQVLISFFLLKMGHGVISVALVYCAISLLGTIITVFYSKFFLKQKVRLVSSTPEEKNYRKKLFKEIVIFSAFVIINVVASIINSNMDKALLGFFSPDSVANYQLGYTIFSYLVSFTTIIATVSTKRIMNAYYTKGKEEMDKVFLSVSKAQTILTMLIIGGFCCVGRDFILLWLQEERNVVFIVAITLMITGSLVCSSTMASVSKQILNLHRKASLITLGMVIANVSLSILFVSIFPKDYSIYGCLLGTVISSFLCDWVLMSFFDVKKTKISVGKFYLSFLTYLSISIVLSVLINGSFYLVSAKIKTILSFLIKGSVFVLIYSLIVILLNRNTTLLVLRKIIGIFKRKNDKLTAESNE